MNESRFLLTLEHSGNEDDRQPVTLTVERINSSGSQFLVTKIKTKGYGEAIRNVANIIGNEACKPARIC